MTDAEACVTSWNPGAESLFGIAAADAIGQHVASLITNRMAARRGGDLHEAIASRTNWRGDAEIVRPSGDTLFIEATLRGVTDERGIRSGTLIVAHDVDARRRTELESAIRARQQAVIASLGQRALAGIDFQLLMDQAMSMAVSTLQVSAAATFELVDHGAGLLLRAGEGWESARVGETRLPTDSSTYPGCALTSDGSAVTIDPRREGGPVVDAFHLREGMTSGAAVVVPGRSGPYGLLLVSDRRERRFSRDDVHFLQAIANVIGAAFERSGIDAELRAELALHDATLEAAADGIFVTDSEGRVRRYNQRLVDMWGFPPDVLRRADAEQWMRLEPSPMRGSRGAAGGFPRGRPQRRRAERGDQVEGRPRHRTPFAAAAHGPEDRGTRLVLPRRDRSRPSRRRAPPPRRSDTARAEAREPGRTGRGHRARFQQSAGRHVGTRRTGPDGDPAGGSGVRTGHPDSDDGSASGRAHEPDARVLRQRPLRPSVDRPLGNCRRDDAPPPNRSRQERRDRARPASAAPRHSTAIRRKSDR